MPFYHTCPECGAALDPGERCDCRKNPSELTRKEKYMAIVRELKLISQLIDKER
jgi:hypothetical protein